MDSKEMLPGAFVDSSPVLRARRLSGVISTAKGESEGEVLDILEIAVESIAEGFSIEGTNQIVGEAQLRALRKPRTITWE